MKKIDAHAHIFERIASFGKCGELRPIGTVYVDGPMAMKWLSYRKDTEIKNLWPKHC